MTMVNPVSSANNTIAQATAAVASKDVEKQIKKVEETKDAQQAPQMVDAPNPAVSANDVEEADEVVNQITTMLNKIKEELKDTVGGNIKRASKHELPPDVKEKVRGDLKAAFDATKKIYKEIEEIVGNRI